MFRSRGVADYLRGVTLLLYRAPAELFPVTSFYVLNPLPYMIPERGRFAPVVPLLFAKMVKLDFIPRANSDMLILASPSISKRLKMAMSSCLVDKWPIERKKRFKLLESI